MTALTNGKFVDGYALFAADLNAACVPVGGIIPWLKTFGAVAFTNTGAASDTVAGKLKATGGVGNFTTVCAVGQVVYNVTDSTFAYITAVDDVDTLSLSADIFVAGEAYLIYKTPSLSSGWVECNGQTISDAASLFNGVTAPNLNGLAGGAAEVDGARFQRFLRGQFKSGTAAGADTHTLTEAEMPAHSHTLPNTLNDANNPARICEGQSSIDTYINTSTVGGSAAHNNMPSYYEVVFIMRVH